MVELRGWMMNKIEKFTPLDKASYGYLTGLIDELCPDGVEFRALGEVCLSINAGGDLPENYQKAQKVPTKKFPYPIYSNGSDEKALYGYTDNYKVDDEAVTISARGTIGYHTVRLAKFTPIVRLITLISNIEIITSKFLNYALDITKIGHSGGSIPQLTVPNVKKIKIPIPPLTIQKEIVKILDNFTQLEAELKAELEARKKQYEHYRETLLSFDDGVEFRTLGEVDKVSMCKRIFKNQTSAVGQIPFYKIGTFGKMPNAFISQEIFNDYRKKYSFPKEGDVLLSASGTIGRRVIYDGEPAYFQDSNIIWIDNDESKVLNKFLYYFYSIVTWQTEGGTIKRLYNDNLKKIKIPIPPLTEQKRIVAILDKFDALVNDISVGLPAEITARRKQYEYYRNQLLTFTPLDSFASNGVNSR